MSETQFLVDVFGLLGDQAQMQTVREIAIRATAEILAAAGHERSAIDAPMGQGRIHSHGLLEDFLLHVRPHHGAHDYLGDYWDDIWESAWPEGLVRVIFDSPANNCYWAAELLRAVDRVVENVGFPEPNWFAAADFEDFVAQWRASFVRELTAMKAKGRPVQGPALASVALGEPFRARLTPEQEQKLLPVVIRLFEGAMELGYVKFKQAARYVRQFIAGKLGQEAADAIPLETLQGAYVSVAGRHKDKPISPIAEVGAVSSMAEIDAAGQVDTTVVNDIEEALKGASSQAGKLGWLNSVPAGFDEETYRQAVPHFRAALAQFREAGKTLKDLFKLLIGNFGEGIEPYAIRFAKDERLTDELRAWRPS